MQLWFFVMYVILTEDLGLNSCSVTIGWWIIEYPRIMLAWITAGVSEENAPDLCWNLNDFTPHGQCRNQWSLRSHWRVKSFVRKQNAWFQRMHWGLFQAKWAVLLLYPIYLKLSICTHTCTNLWVDWQFFCDVIIQFIIIPEVPIHCKIQSLKTVWVWYSLSFDIQSTFMWCYWGSQRQHCWWNGGI